MKYQLLTIYLLQAKNDYASLKRSNYLAIEVAELFEQLSSKNLRNIESEDKEIKTKRGYKVIRYRFLTDLIDGNKEKDFQIVIDISENHSPPYVLVTLYRPYKN